MMSLQYLKDLVRIIATGLSEDRGLRLAWLLSHYQAPWLMLLRASYKVMHTLRPLGQGPESHKTPWYWHLSRAALDRTRNMLRRRRGRQTHGSSRQFKQSRRYEDVRLQSARITFCNVMPEWVMSDEAVRSRGTTAQVGHRHLSTVLSRLRRHL